jgi:hypothetical protein
MLQTIMGVVIILVFLGGLFLCCGWSLRGGPKASRITRTSPGPEEDGLFLVRSPSSTRTIKVGKGTPEYDQSIRYKSHMKDSKENFLDDRESKIVD